MWWSRALAASRLTGASEHALCARSAAGSLWQPRRLGPSGAGEGRRLGRRRAAALAGGLAAAASRRGHAGGKAFLGVPRLSADQPSHSSCGAERALRRLEDEVAKLQAHPPPFLEEISAPSVAPLAIDGQGNLVIPDAREGPWHIDVVVQGEPTDPVYCEPLRFRLRFTSGWPHELPEVYVRGLSQFGALSPERTPPALFYEVLAERCRGNYLLEEVVRMVRQLLLEPLAALGFTERDAEEEGSFAQRVRLVRRAAREIQGQRLAIIRRYEPLARHPALFGRDTPLRREWFAPAFWAACESGAAWAWQQVLTELLPGNVYSFQLFSEEFCDMLVEEVFSFHASGLPANAPNTMNRYGLALGDVGLEALCDKLQALLQPLGAALFPGAGRGWDGHHCFVVRYRMGEDLGLDMHNDDSDVTFNVCLGLQFTGAGLQFCGHVGAPDHRHHTITYEHRKGWCVVHVGRQRHGADDILSGERLNLILWNTSSTYRQSRLFNEMSYYREDGVPDEVCLSYTHDRDFGSFRQYPPGREDFRGKGWCPPPPAEYEGFREDTAA